MAFAHLHVHSEYSPIDSLAKVKDLVAMAAADCNPALAISDHGTLAGIWKLGQYAAIHGLKAIPAIEAYLSIGDRFEHNALTVPDDDADPDVEGGKGTKRKVYEHLTLLATTRTGWRNLVQMTNASHDSFWYKPRLDYDLLEQHGEGLIVLTGCLGGPVAGPLSRGDRAQAVTNLRRLVRCVGRENVYVEVMDHGIEAQLRIMDDLRSVAAEVGVPLVATNDSHYIHANQRDAHEAWLAVGTHAVLSSTERFAFHGHGHHLRTEAEMRALQGGAAWWQEACDNTVTIAARVADDVLPASKLRLPKFPVPDGFADSGTYLKHLVREGAFERYGSDPARPEGRFLPPAVNAQLKFEFTVVDNAGLPDYFLIVHDIIEWARSDRGLPTAEFPNGEPGKKTPIRVGPGRGSAAGSTISYALKIVGVEPMANGLLFERFLNPQRTGMPDIDVDFEQGRRAEVLRYIAARFGRDRVARIGTFGIDQSRAAIKDGARVLELTGVGNKLSSLVPIGGNGKPYAFKALDDQADKAGEAFRAAVRDSGDPADHILTLARAFEGVTKQEGIHACGTLIADEPMAPLVPLRRDLSKGATDEDLLITVWDGKDVDDYGLLKMDVLGLRNLDVISAAVRFIEQTTGELIEPDDLMPNNPDDIERDTKAWDLISSGRTAGVFQLESAGMTKLAEQVAPNSLADLTALVALFRPGPLAAGMHEHYAARKNGREAVDYGYLSDRADEQSAIGSVLDVSYGTCLAADTPVYSVTRGRYVTIAEIELGEIVQGVDETTLCAASAPVTQKVMTGVKDTLVTRFRGGSYIRSTADHLFLTPDGWRRADQLVEGSVVAAPWSLKSSGQPLLSPAHARVLGFLLGDGYLGAYGTTFVNSDGGLHRSFDAAVSHAFPDTRVRFEAMPGRAASRSRVTNGKGHGGRACGVVSWLRSMNLLPPASQWREGGALSENKRIPAEWMAADNGTLAPLVAALWDCDGHFGEGRGAGTATYKTISQGLAEDIQTALLRFGVVSNLSRFDYDSRKGRRTGHQITVGGEHLVKLIETLLPHLASQAKASKAVEILTAGQGLRAGMVSDVPRAAILGAANRSGMSLREAARAIGVDRRTLGSGTRNGWYSSERVGRAVAHLTGDAELLRLLNTRWVRVLSQDVGEPAEVWDVTVDRIHNFVAAGVVVHNCVYQEQLMKLSEVVGGLEPGMRNKLQKAFSKKKADLMSEVKDAMFAGALAGRGTSGVVFSPTTLDKLWATFEGSAAYLFNASHACAYGFVSYQTAYLKANWPVQYGAALLSVTDDDDKRRAAIRSLQVEGIHILAPDINRSGVNTQPDGDAVRLGLSEVKGVGKNAGHIVAERDQNGRFVSLADALARVQIPKDKDGKLGALPVNVAEALVEAGAFDEFGPRMGQVMIVRGVKVDGAIAPVDAEWGVLERSARQRERLGLITGEHPLATLREQIRSYSTAGQKPLSVRAVQRATDGERIMLLGVLAGWTEKAYKRGRMVTLTLEGSTESVEGVMWDEDRARLPKIPTIGDVVVLSAQVRVRLVETERIDDHGETVTDAFERRDLTVKRVATVPVSDPARIELPAAPVLVMPASGQAAVVAAMERSEQVGATASVGELSLVEPPDDDWPTADEELEPDIAGEPVLASVHHLPGTPVAPEVIRLPVGSHGREHPILRRAAATFELPEHFMEPAGGVWLLRTPRGRTAVVIVGDHDAPVAVDAGHPTGWSALDVAQAAAA